MLQGAATAAGTTAYRNGLAILAKNGHFREWRGLALSSVGLGTYLGQDDDATDRLYEAAVERALLSGRDAWHARRWWWRPRGASSPSTARRLRDSSAQATWSEAATA